jgi:hypothetical protein
MHHHTIAKAAIPHTHAWRRLISHIRKYVMGCMDVWCVVCVSTAPIDQVIADWQKTLTSSAGDSVATALTTPAAAAAPSPLFLGEGKKKDAKKKEEPGDLLICLSVPSDDCPGYPTPFIFFLCVFLFLFLHDF